MKKNKITSTPILPELWCNDQIGWASIPKNANMATRRVMTALGAPRHHYDEETPENLFCVIRDPRQRVIAGIGEYQRRSKTVPDTTDLKRLLLDFIYDPEPFDEHVEPQCCFIDHVTHKITHVCRFESLVADMLTVPGLTESVVTEFIIEPKLSQSKTGDIAALVKKHRALVDKCIKQYYTVDMDIFESANPLSIINQL